MDGDERPGVPGSTSGCHVRAQGQSAAPSPLSLQFRHSHHGARGTTPPVPSPPRHTQDGSSQLSDPSPPVAPLSDTSLPQYPPAPLSSHPISDRLGRGGAGAGEGGAPCAAVPGRSRAGGRRGVGGMAGRLRAAMALLLFQALPRGLPASVEPAQVGGSPGGATP